jgi:hypothetical protein
MNIARFTRLTRLRLIVMAVILAVAGLAIAVSQFPSAQAATTNTVGHGAPAPPEGTAGCWSR